MSEAKPARASDPAVGEIFRIIEAEGISVNELARKSGYSNRLLRKWKRGSVPQINTVRDVLGALGYELPPPRKVSHGPG